MTKFQMAKRGDDVKPRERGILKINKWDQWWKEGVKSCLKLLSQCVVMLLIEKETWEENVIQRKGDSFCTPRKQAAVTLHRNVQVGNNADAQWGAGNAEST